MSKIAISICHGGFNLSHKALLKYAELKGIKNYDEMGDFGWLVSDDIERNDPALIETLETIGLLDCNGALSNINIVEIPDDVIWEIEEYDGNEWVSEVHRRWS